MGIFEGLFKKKEKIVIQNKIADIKKDASNDNNKNDSICHLIDGELPAEWYYETSDFIKPRDNKLYELSIAASKATSLEEEKQLLQQFIDFYYKYKNECFSKDECYQKYFTDMHMHCHNSKNPDFEFVTPKEERLKYINENYEQLLEEENLKQINEKKKEKLMIGLKEKIIEEIKSNPGILQNDLYTKFDPILKDEISTIIYYSNKDGKIIREKEGRTYKLFIK